MSEIVNVIADARAAALDNRFDDAARHAAAVLQQLPSCLLALRIQAWAQLELDHDEALATFEDCATYDPEDALAYVGQAIWYQQRGQNEGAIRFWTYAWELDPQNQDIRRALVKLTGELPESNFADGVALLRAGHFDEAAEILRPVSAERQEAAVPLSLLTALCGSGAQREAFEVASTVVARYPRSVKAGLYVAALEDRAGRTLRSREAIARAEQVDPGLTLFDDVVRQVGLQAAIDLHRASRTPLAAAR